LVSNEQRWLNVGACIRPSETSGTTLGHISAAANSSDHKLILLGDLNVDLENIINYRQAATVDTIASLGVTIFSYLSDREIQSRTIFTLQQTKSSKHEAHCLYLDRIGCIPRRRDSCPYSQATEVQGQGPQPDPDHAEYSTMVHFCLPSLILLVAAANAATGADPFFVQGDGCGGSLVADDIVLTAAHNAGAFDRKVHVGPNPTSNIAR
jgi:hypothetical protein